MRSAVDWERQLTPELDNLRAARTWAVDGNDADVALRLLGSMPGESVAVQSALHLELDRAIALPGATDHPSRPGVLVLAGYRAIQRGDSNGGPALRRGRRCRTAARHGAGSGSLAGTGLIAMPRGVSPSMVSVRGTRLTAICGRSGDLVAAGYFARRRGHARFSMGDLAGAVPCRRGGADDPPGRRPGLGALTLPMVAFVLADTHRTGPGRLRAKRSSWPKSSGAGRDQRSGTWPGTSPPGSAIDARRSRSTAGHRRMALVGWRPVLGIAFTRVGDLLAPDDPRAAAVFYGAGDALAHGVASRPKAPRSPIGLGFLAERVDPGRVPRVGRAGQTYE